MTPQAAIDLIFSWVSRITGWAFLLLVFAAVLQAFGIRLPVVALPVLDPTRLCYLAGAWYLIRK